jgi:HEAT repeat protein
VELGRNAATLTESYAAQSVATVTITNVFDVHLELLCEKVMAMTGAKAVRGVGGATITITAAPVSDLNELADMIDFGDVDKIDAATRTISVTGDRSWPSFSGGSTDPHLPGFYVQNLAFLQSPKVDRRREAAQALILAQSEEVRGEVEAALEKMVVSDTDAGVRREAVKALAAWEEARCVPLVRRLLGDEDGRVVEQALHVLRDYPDPVSYKAAAKLLNSPHAAPAAEFLWAAGPAAEPAVLEALGGIDPLNLRSALDLLDAIGTEAAVPYLVRALSDRDVAAFHKDRLLDLLCRLADENAAEALVEVFPTVGVPAGKRLIAMGPQAETAVLELLKHSVPGVQYDGMVILVDIGGEESLKALRQLARTTSNRRIRDAAREAVSLIVKRLRETEESQPDDATMEDGIGDDAIDDPADEDDE